MTSLVAKKVDDRPEPKRKIKNEKLKIINSKTQNILDFKLLFYTFRFTL